MEKKIFDNWNILKQKIEQKEPVQFRQGQIYFMSVGQNIGQEVFGKKDLFLRPVLIYRKLSKRTFIGIPLSSQEKSGSYFFTFRYTKKTLSTALLNQIKVFDIKRAEYYDGYINISDFAKLKHKVINLLDITPNPRGKGSGHSSKKLPKSRAIIPDIENYVKNKVFIIAEAGVNHNGDINLAKKLIDVAVEAGADAVKFQTFKAKNLVSKDAKKATYQQKNMQDNDDSQFNMLKKLELDLKAHIELIDYCKSKNIMFLSTPFDHDSINLLNNLQLPIFKIPSGEITNLPYLRDIGSLKKEVILSTGMANMDEIKDALNILINEGTKKENITILHANTMYPTPIEDVNLNAMLTIGKTFHIAFGYSDHTLVIEIPIAAVSLGASVIEKHFTLDKNMPGPDHKASLEQDELKAMVKAIRNIEVALGDGIKKPSKSEMQNIEVVRKSIVAKKSIIKGERLTKENLTVKRPGNGISPMKWDEVIGTIASRDYKEDELL